MSVLYATTKQELVAYQRAGKDYTFDIGFANSFGDGDYKRDCIATRSYSSKYKNLTEKGIDAETVKFYNYKNYLTINISYFDGSQKSNSVYITYPHLSDFREFLSELLNLVNSDDYFTSNNVVKPEMVGVCIHSESMSFDKYLQAQPFTIDIVDSNASMRGAILYIIDPASNTETSITLSENEIFNIYSSFNEVNSNELRSICTSLYYGSLDYKQANSSSSNSSSGSNSYSAGGEAPARRRPVSASPARRTATPATPTTAAPVSRRVKPNNNFTPKPIEEVEDVKSEVIENDNVDFEVKPKRRGTVAKVSFSDITEEAKNHKYTEDADDDINFDE